MRETSCHLLVLHIGQCTIRCQQCKCSALNNIPDTSSGECSRWRSCDCAIINLVCACRLLRWGASTAADAARLEQGQLEHRQGVQTQMGSAPSPAELAQPPADLGATHQEHLMQQWQQQQGRTADAVKHMTLPESGELPGASAEKLLTAQAQLHQAGHGYMATEGSNSNILRHGQELDAPLLQPLPGAHSQHRRLQGGIAALQPPRLTPAADSAVAQGYAKAAGHMIGHANQQTLRHRQRAGAAQGKGRGHKGIVSFAQLHTSRVAPEVATQDAAAPSHTEDATTLPARAPEHIRARQQNASSNQDKARAGRAMYRKPGRPMMRVALQRSMQQVKACTLQLVEQGIQQRAMQQALEDMITMCDKKFGPGLQMQQQ